MRSFFSSVLVAAFLLAPAASFADEGMWTLDRFPSAKVKATYGVNVTPAFLETVRRATVRLPGCSGSFVSAAGLVMTNHHCARGCINAVSTPELNYLADGFIAKLRDDEVKCPGFAIESLVEVTHVTDRVAKATAGTSGATYNARLRVIRTQIETECTARSLTCQLVSLYSGSVFDRYAYRRYEDVRLVFAPEDDIAAFGGDPDNFNFPRYDLDCSFLRIYDGGAPLASPAYFRWNTTGMRPGTPIFVAGNPGRTERFLTVAELELVRHAAIEALRVQSELRGILYQFSAESPEHARADRNTLFGLENGLKVNVGHIETLEDPAFIARKRSDEAAFRLAIANSPALRRSAGSAFERIARAERRAEQLSRTLTWREGRGTPGTILTAARTIVRATAEAAKPAAVRLPEYGEANLPRVPFLLGARAPFNADFERTTITFGLTKMREYLGRDDPYVQALLGNEAPEDIAARIVTSSKLGDPAARLALYNGGAAAVDASEDPAIVLARKVDGLARAIRTQFENEVRAPIAAASETLGQARFAVYGNSAYPDATFTLRMSYGAVAGWSENGKAIAPYTTFDGAFARATGSEPYVLPKSWLAARPKLDGATPFNFSSTGDIIGGNSGSPVIDASLRVVGLAFDGNIHSIGGDYYYDGAQNRMIAVDARGMLAAIRTVYGFDRLASELTGER